MYVNYIGGATMGSIDGYVFTTYVLKIQYSGGNISEKNTIVGLFWTYITCPSCKLMPHNDQKTTDSGGTDSMSWLKGRRSLYDRIS